ncbi:hypothetical protein D9615_008885 [Tricholomella constricta]|uniref:Uncharacterized protein n=1 Tax=Tricholomella constricta TaxID=117010 RepID=A0A8H5GZW2_9AGAR|nr:hypothetical protein D9615_008885 [Tricholomella constricta]
MTRVYLNPTPLPHIPDDITLAQFMLEYQHPLKPARRDVPCLIDDNTGREISFEELKSNTRALANMLRSAYNIGENDVVMISSPNHIDYPTILWAVLLVGGIVSCSNPQFTAGELGTQLKVSKTNFVIGHSTNIATILSAARVAGLPSDRIILIDKATSHHHGPSIPNVHDLIQVGLKLKLDFKERVLAQGEGRTKVALLSWSSGTTGKPKAVAITHHALIANVIQMAAHNRVDGAHSFKDTWGYRPGDVGVGVLPFYHVAGLVISLHFVLFCAMSVVVVEKYNIFNLLESIARHRITHLIIVPPVAIDLCKACTSEIFDNRDIAHNLPKQPAVGNYDLGSVKYVMIGAAPVAKDVQAKLYGLFPDAQIGQAYGLTEMTTTLAMIAGTQKRGPLGSGGRLLPGIQARVIKPNGSLADYGEIGELIVRGPAAALGYLHDDQATKATFINGWIYTGDQVSISETNEIFVVDRLKELLKVKGFQVSPAELEGCLLSHTDIMDCCVIGIPDDYCGEVPLAYVVLTADAHERSALSAEAERRIKLRQRTSGLANGLRSKFGIGENDVVILFSRNHVDYPVAIWATHRLGGVISGANPDFSSQELLYQLEQTRATLMIVHSDSLNVALAAARHANFPYDRIILFDGKNNFAGNRLTVDALIQHGLRLPGGQTFVERKLNPGEAKTKLAFLSFSSGTTGKPKAVAIAHYSLLANVIQIAAHNNVNKDYCDVEDQRFRPGDVAIGVLPFYHIYGLIINMGKNWRRSDDRQERGIVDFGPTEGNHEGGKFELITEFDVSKSNAKVKGFQVAPAELEGCILDHEDVSGACVVGIPDDYSGEVPLAFVVLTADATRRINENPSSAEKIKASIIQAYNKVGYKHLAGGVEFIPEIPTSPSGKLLRRVLREKAKVLQKTRSKL